MFSSMLLRRIFPVSYHDHITSEEVLQKSDLEYLLRTIESLSGNRDINMKYQKLITMYRIRHMEPYLCYLLSCCFSCKYASMNRELDNVKPQILVKNNFL